MKRQEFAIVMLLCVGLLSGCGWLGPPEVTGRWEGTARLRMTPDGPKPYEIVLRLTETDGVITGTLRIVLWYQVTDVIGTRTGKHVAMTARVVPGPDWVTLEGEVRGRTMAGTCTTDDETEVWEVTRVN